jgi:hypothetical protein
MTNHGRYYVMKDHHASDDSSKGSTCFGECANGEHVRWGSDVQTARTFWYEANIALGRYDDDVERKCCVAEAQADTCPPRRRHETHFRRSFTEDAA